MSRGDRIRAREILEARAEDRDATRFDQANSAVSAGWLHQTPIMTEQRHPYSMEVAQRIFVRDMERSEIDLPPIQSSVQNPICTTSLRKK
jgi:hypothetical protein